MKSNNSINHKHYQSALSVQNYKQYPKENNNPKNINSFSPWQIKQTSFDQRHQNQILQQYSATINYDNQTYQKPSGRNNKKLNCKNKHNHQNYYQAEQRKSISPEKLTKYTESQFLTNFYKVRKNLKRSCSKAESISSQLKINQDKLKGKRKERQKEKEYFENNKIKNSSITSLRNSFQTQKWTMMKSSARQRYRKQLNNKLKADQCNAKNNIFLSNNNNSKFHSHSISSASKYQSAKHNDSNQNLQQSSASLSRPTIKSFNNTISLVKNMEILTQARQLDIKERTLQQLPIKNFILQGHYTDKESNQLINAVAKRKQTSYILKQKFSQLKKTINAEQKQNQFSSGVRRQIIMKGKEKQKENLFKVIKLERQINNGMNRML